MVLGTAPAHAASTTHDVFTGHYGPFRPRYDWAVAQTRDEADRRCVETYGFRARGTDPVELFPEDDVEPSETKWYVAWKCSSN